MGKGFEFLFGWADLVVLILLMVGVSRGRKRGMSEELLDVVKWLLIVVASAYFYFPIGQVLAESTAFSDLFCYRAVYALCVLLFIGLFAYLRPRIGEKIVDSEFFGRGEYYLGMMAGFIRYACIILVLFAFLNSRQYTPEELRAGRAYQDYNFGTDLFPTPSTLQSAVFEKSLAGTAARTYLSVFLIRPTVAEEKQLGRQGVVRSRERMVQDVLDKR